MTPNKYPTSLFSSNLEFENENTYGGQLSIAGCSAESLVKEFGSPLYVIDQDDFYLRTKAWKSALDNEFESNNLYYAAKSFISIEVAKWLKELNVGLDVCSGGELLVALAAKFPAANIEFHGNNKSESEIKLAIDSGVGVIVIDSFDEIKRVSSIAKALRRFKSLFEINSWSRSTYT